MVTPRIIANLVVFLLVSAVLITYGAVTLLGNPLEHGDRISTTFDDASGVLPGFSAAYDGVIVGTVADTELVDDGVRVTVELDPGVTVPSDVEARVVRASAVGEQRVELNPVEGGGDGPPLEDGDEVPPSDQPAPPEISEVLETASTLFEEIPAEDLNTVIEEAAVTLDGREQDLRELTRDLDLFAEQILAHEASFRSLLETAPPVLDSVTEVSPELISALEDTEALTQVLSDRRYDLVALMQHGTQLAAVADELVSTDGANLACFLDDAAGLTEFLGAPETISNIDQALGINQAFFGPIDSLAVSGHAADVGYGAPARDDQRWLRVLTIMPPASPPAIAYHPQRPTPPTLPGDGCTSPLGEGVGPAQQADAAAPALGGYVVYPGGASGSEGGTSEGAAEGTDPSTYNPVAAMAAAQQ
jgi:phospholipid/cholesterol/gamma-HCH transport system substrate-binding protein